MELGLGRIPTTVTFAVRDTGIGIAAADVPYIFERFWRADRARSRMSERGGFGLGLAISQWIAQAHGGTLTRHHDSVAEAFSPSLSRLAAGRRERKHATTINSANSLILNLRGITSPSVLRRARISSQLT